MKLIEKLKAEGYARVPRRYAQDYDPAYSVWCDCVDTEYGEDQRHNLILHKFHQELRGGHGESVFYYFCPKCKGKEGGHNSVITYRRRKR